MQVLKGRFKIHRSLYTGAWSKEAELSFYSMSPSREGGSLQSFFALAPLRDYFTSVFPRIFPALSWVVSPDNRLPVTSFLFSESPEAFAGPSFISIGFWLFWLILRRLKWSGADKKVSPSDFRPLVLREILRLYDSSKGLLEKLTLPTKANSC